MPADTPPGPRHDRPRSGPPPIPFLPAEEEPTAVTLHVSEVTPATGVVPGGAGTTPVTGHTFDLLGEIARGGMGVVYRARDNTLGRDVAVKLLRDDFPPDSPVAHRFFDEARITGRLQHPGVPPVYQYGTLADGRPFLAMKLIEGRTLDDLLKARASPADDRGRFVAAFEQICQAVGYAHAQEIVHRDLKPANVMVGAFGEVQVMDWGIARGPKDEGGRMKEEPAPAGSSSSFILPPSSFTTSPGEVKGTPAYMAPEQARGEIDRIGPRADVFALGGILCAILTGQPPFVRDGFYAAVRAAGSADLEDALTRLKACGADPELVALCRRCLAPDPTHRPADGRAVAAAVVAHRATVEARARMAEAERVAAVARAAEERKRRRVQLALALAVGLLLLGGGAFAWWRDRENGRQRLKDAEFAAERRTKAEQARQGVEAGLKLATQLRGQYRFREADAALAGVRELAAGESPARVAEIDMARQDLAFVVRLDDIRYGKWIFTRDPSGNGEFATRTAPADYRQAFAERGYDPAAAPPRELGARIAASAVKADLVAAIDDWALYEPDPGLRDRLLEVARFADPGPWSDRLRDPAVRTDQAAVAALSLEADPKTTPPALLIVLTTLLERSRVNPTPILTAARTQHPSNFELAFALGNLYAARKQDEQTIGPYEAARSVRPENLTVLNNLGHAQYLRKDYAAAIATLRQAIKFDPGYSFKAHLNLALVLEETREHDEAITVLEEARRRVPDNARVHYNLGVALMSKNRQADAEVSFREAIRLNPAYARAHYNLGVVLTARNRHAEAAESYRSAVQHDPNYAEAHYNLGNALHRIGKVDEAMEAWQRAGEVGRYAPAYYNLGNAWVAKRNPEKSMEAWKLAVEADPKFTPAWINLASVYEVRGQLDDAIRCARAVVKADPKLALGHGMLGEFLRQTGDLPGARAALTEAARIDSKWSILLEKLPPGPGGKPK